MLGCSSGLLPWGGNFAKTQKLVVKFSFLHVYSVGFIKFQRLFPPTRLFGLHVYLVVQSSLLGAVNCFWGSAKVIYILSWSLKSGPILSDDNPSQNKKLYWLFYTYKLNHMLNDKILSIIALLSGCTQILCNC